MLKARQGYILTRTRSQQSKSSSRPQIPTLLRGSPCRLTLANTDEAQTIDGVERVVAYVYVN